MAEQKVTFFKKHEKVYPKDTDGCYRRLKWIAMAILLAIYYISPFIRFDRGDGVPDQAILIDLYNKRAFFFWIEIWPQENYYFAGLLMIAAFCLFFVTSMFGRVWCGYACFQTVWTDLFVKVEHLIQGDRNARIKLDKGPMTFEKVWKKILTHMLWLLIGFMTGGAMVLYFNDAPTLIKDAFALNVPLSVAGWVFFLTATTYMMAGFARDHVCAFMCPYARFQSAMFDKDTLIIGYDAERGEPRQAHKQGETWEGRGDCIDCGQCVHVCPMGIDIRKGLQLQCIACGLCVDACNAVMDKVGRPRGLVRYDTENNLIARGMAKSKGVAFRDQLHILRPRTFYYIAILTFMCGFMLYHFMHRASFDLHVLHERNPLFVQLSSGDIRNNFSVKIINKTHEEQMFSLRVEGIEGADLSISSVRGIDSGNIPVDAAGIGAYRVMVSAKNDAALMARRPITFVAKNQKTGEEYKTESMFILRRE